MTIWHGVANGTEAFLHVPLNFSFHITWVIRNLKESINFHGSQQDQGKIKNPPMKWVISHKYSLYLLLFTENEESLAKPARFFFFSPFQFQMKQICLERFQPALLMATGRSIRASLPWREMWFPSLFSWAANSYMQAQHVERVSGIRLVVCTPGLLLFNEE